MPVHPLKQLRHAVRRTVLDPALRTIDAWYIRQAVRQLRGVDVPDAALIRRLHRAWGNESFSAGVRYVSELAQRILTAEGPILECGSGLTTIVAGVLAERRGLEVWSLEQDHAWVEHVGRFVATLDIRTVRLIHAPLKRYDGFVWYDVSEVALPAEFDLVVCDGPAIFEHWGDAHPAWRYGLMPVLQGRDVKANRILLDDATEPRAARLLRRWADEFGLQHRLITSADGDCAWVARTDAARFPRPHASPLPARSTG